MSSSWITVIAVLVVAFGLAFAVGRLMTSRSGRLRGDKESPALDADDIQHRRTRIGLVRGDADAARPEIERIVGEILG